MKRILIVDDHCIFRQGVKKILIESFEQAQIDEAASTEEAISKVISLDWDVVVTDINMPGRSGLDLIHDIKAFKPALPVLALSVYEEDQMALRAFRAGANGYLSKRMTSDELKLAIQRILEGKRYISDNVAEILVNEFQTQKKGNQIKILSDREYFVLVRFSDGETAAEIARDLSLSVKTIFAYRRKIMEKLGLKKATQLVGFIKATML